MTKDQISARLQRLAATLGGAKLAARQLGISATYFSEVVRMRKEPAGKLLTALGLERVVTYRRRK